MTESDYDGLRKQFHYIMDRFDEQRAQLADVHEQLAAARSHATSSDGLVEVSTNSAGMVVEVRLAANTFEQTTPETLARSFTEAAGKAAALAQQHTAEIIAPITAAAEAMPDLPDLIPGAPSLRELRASLHPNLSDPPPEPH